MKTNHKIILVIVVAWVVFGTFLFFALEKNAREQGFIIKQDVELCGNPAAIKWQLYTRVWYKNDILYESRSWTKLGYRCFEKPFIDSLKPVEFSLAEDFIKRYKEAIKENGDE